MSYVPNIALQKTAFGEASTAENTPVIQLSTQYRQTGQTESILVNGGTSGSENSKFYAQTPAAADSLGSILSERALTYRPGQGAKGRFTAKFDAPVAGNEQDAGLLGFNDTLTFGYDVNQNFGIWYRRFAKQEVQVLTITTGAGGTETATVTVDGVAYSVSLSPGAIEHTAYEIAESLNTQVSLWDFDSTYNSAGPTATVTAVQNLVSATVGSFAFTSATAAGAWAQSEAAQEWTADHIPQSSWNGDFDFTITPGKLTPYEISFEYLGGGGIEFKAENPETSDFEIVHTIQAAGQNDNPTLLNPTFRLGVASENKTASAVVRVESASLGGFIEGKKVNTSGSRGTSNTVLTVGPVLTNIITIRNRNHYGGIRNLAEVIIGIVGASTDAVKPVDVQVILGAKPTASNSFTFEDFNTADSIVQIAKNNTPVTNGEVIAEGEPGQLDFSNLDQVLIPGKSITIAMRVSSGSSADMKASAIWFEDQ
jgi:hypothetical protein